MLPTSSDTATAAPIEARHVIARERADQRPQGIADEQSQHDRDQDRLGVLQHEDATRAPAMIDSARLRTSTGMRMTSGSALIFRRFLFLVGA